MHWLRFHRLCLSVSFATAANTAKAFPPPPIPTIQDMNVTALDHYRSLHAG
jgi:hypothetical protein